MSPELPWIDEHSTVIDADPQATWEALGSMLGRGAARGRTRAFARLLGVRDAPSRGAPVRLEEGSPVVGFRVVRANRPTLLALEGEHRYSRYALTFRLEELGPGRTEVRAETHAEFPGVQGRVYRALVIGSRAHVITVRSMLRAVKRRAER